MIYLDNHTLIYCVRLRQWEWHLLSSCRRSIHVKIRQTEKEINALQQKMWFVFSHQNPAKPEFSHHQIVIISPKLLIFLCASSSHNAWRTLQPNLLCNSLQVRLVNACTNRCLWMQCCIAQSYGHHVHIHKYKSSIIPLELLWWIFVAS